ncbi:hypothetical protein SH668x_003111 [Planctomicrobium sp. SH668]|uniref:hypothetical protein n=1 Tax=Planctomicrobium sp. SH668 TaxID=3448126 RepID=UPI003F5C8EDB
MSILSKRFTTLVLLIMMIGQDGCTLIQPDPSILSTSKPILPPIVDSRDTIDLEVIFIDRRIGDPLIGDGLWSSLSGVSAVNSENRANLKAEGFRFGMASSRLPRQLQSLLKMSDEEDPNRRIAPQRYTVPSGQEAVVMVSSVPDGTPLVLKGDAEARINELNNAQCLLRVTAKRVDDNWAKLTILPEVRHGSKLLRPIATDQSWQLNETQSHLPFYQHRISAELNTGEVVAIGLDPATPDGLASCFFRSDISSGLERLILIRVVDMRKVNPVRVEN